MNNVFTKDNLTLEYKWPETPLNSLFTGLPSRRIFDRFNGFQVLFIINAIAALSEAFAKEAVPVIENTLNNHFIDDANSELSVFNMLKNEDYSNSMDKTFTNSINSEEKYGLEYRLWKLENRH